VQVARETDFGVNDECYSCVTHLGHLISAGDVVLGYDLVSTVSGDRELEESFNSSYVLPDIVLVKKVSGERTDAMDATDEPQKHKTKKRERRKRRQDGKRTKELAESAIRMGFFEDDQERNDDVLENAEFDDDPHLAALGPSFEQYDAVPEQRNATEPGPEGKEIVP
jgi:nonsense-mediated mRNA decay protein 3